MLEKFSRTMANYPMGSFIVLELSTSSTDVYLIFKKIAAFLENWRVKIPVRKRGQLPGRPHFGVIFYQNIKIVSFLKTSGNTQTKAEQLCSCKLIRSNSLYSFGVVYWLAKCMHYIWVTVVQRNLMRVFARIRAFCEPAIHIRRTVQLEGIGLVTKGSASHSTWSAFYAC